MTTTTIALKVLDERIRPYLPAYATSGSAGMDLRACIDAPINLLPDSRRRSWCGCHNDR